MNTLSLFIYLAGVAGNLQALFCTIGVLIAAATIIFVIATIDEDDFHWLRFKRMSFFAVLFLFFGAIIPSQSAMYAIAASQIGETVATSPEGREVISEVKAVLRDYLKSRKDK